MIECEALLESELFELSFQKFEKQKVIKSKPLK